LFLQKGINIFLQKKKINKHSISNFAKKLDAHKGTLKLTALPRQTIGPLKKISNFTIIGIATSGVFEIIHVRDTDAPL
jgi:uncharacterized membrane protein YraQ (UPF0718 family)